MLMYMGEDECSKRDLIDVLENPESVGQHPFQTVYRPEFCMVWGHEVNLLQFDMKTSYSLSLVLLPIPKQDDATSLKVNSSFFFKD